MAYDGTDRRRSHDDAVSLAREARELAMAAIGDIKRHTEVCEQRWLSAHGVMNEVKDAVRGLRGTFLTGGIMVIVGLLGMVGALLVKYVFPA